MAHAGPGEISEQGAAGEGSAGSVRTALENAMVGLFKAYYGRGPTAAKAWVLDDYVVVILEGGLMRNEETMIDAGQEEAVRSFRLSFQQAVRQKAIDAVSEATGRRVVNYHSQIIFDPPRSFEIFVLEPKD
jgi:uncharacterized protein YbcI